jgi:release factor glutamine methyltransferase
MLSAMNQTNPEPSAEDLRALIRDKYYGVLPSDATEKTEYEHDVQRLTAGEPLAYVIGWIPFLGLTISLESRPLIPRPETEWWTEMLIAHLQTTYGDESFELLDLCAGSGAIGCAVLAAFPNAFVSFGEIDAAHRATIEQNLAQNNLDGERAVVEIGDLFDPFEDEQFDIIVSNPPYIPEARTLENSVTAHEPSLALFSGEDGLTLIRRIIADAPMYLLPEGELWIECDSEHTEEARLIAERAGYTEPTVRTDQYGRPRLLVSHFD